MFHRLLAVLLLATTLLPVWAEKKQETRKVDFDLVRKVTLNPKADFYYPKLVGKYMSNTDTTMTLEAYRDLYYGYIFQEDYNPYRVSSYSDKVEELYYKQPHSRAECDSIEKYADLSLNDNMFDFDQMQFYIFVLKEKKKHARANVRQDKLEKLIAAIMSSGKGTESDPWVVICPQHEYFIVNQLGYVADGYDETSPGVDVITVHPADPDKKMKKEVKKFYFDVRMMLQEAKRKGFGGIEEQKQ